MASNIALSYTYVTYSYSYLYSYIATIVMHVYSRLNCKNFLRMYYMIDETDCITLVIIE